MPKGVGRRRMYIKRIVFQKERMGKGSNTKVAAILGNVPPRSGVFGKYTPRSGGFGEWPPRSGGIGNVPPRSGGFEKIIMYLLTKRIGRMVCPVREISLDCDNG